MHILLKTLEFFLNAFNSNDCIVDGYVLVYNILSQAVNMKSNSVKRGLHVLSDIYLVIINLRNLLLKVH
jgi:hypothetical protein